MATIDSKEIIKKLLENEGIYDPEDPQAKSVWSYVNSWGGETCAVYWTVSNDIRTSPYVKLPRMLWSKRAGLTQDGKDWLEKNKNLKENTL